MTPLDHGFERRISVGHDPEADSTDDDEPARLDSSEADRLEHVYGVRPDTVSRYVAMRRFEEIPEDVGNRGFWQARRSPLGSAFEYAERFRGSSHLSRTMERSLAWADSLVALTRTWARAELGGHPLWPALDEDLDTGLRAELRDYAVEWVLPFNVLNGFQNSALPLASFEHPELFGLFWLGADGDTDPSPFFLPQSGLDSLRARFARALGLRTPRESHRLLAFLEDRDSARVSLARLLERTRGIPPTEADSVRDAIMGDLGYGDFDVDVDADFDSLEVRLATGIEPWETNGTWDEESRRVTWRGWMTEPGSNLLLPVFCLARWSVPDSVRQEEWFGRVLLSDESLAGYCVDYALLDAAHRAEWDHALANLKDGDLSPLRDFRFRDERRRGRPRGDTPSRAAPLIQRLVPRVEVLEEPPAAPSPKADDSGGS